MTVFVAALVPVFVASPYGTSFLQVNSMTQFWRIALFRPKIMNPLVLQAKSHAKVVEKNQPHFVVSIGPMTKKLKTCPKKIAALATL